MTNGSLMDVKSIAECSKGSILQYFWPALSDNLSWKTIFRLFESGPFTQVQLYIVFIYFVYTVCYKAWLICKYVP